VLFRSRCHFHGNSLDLCSIVNAKSGRCSENCRFCAQSAHHPVDVETYDCVDLEKAVAMAKENKNFGVERFSLVTAGRTVSDAQLDVFSTYYRRLADETAMSFCASMGFLTPKKAAALKKMGVRRYHCNLEAARSFFPQVCTSHTWEEKVATIAIAKEADLEICSGGIIGMGESFRQRLELAFELRELEVYSIPINILTPIANTPLADLKPLSTEEILTAIALFRLINPQAVIRLAGGRNQLGNKQYKCFEAGANGAIVGNYLTTAGNSLAEDIAMFRRLGFAVKPHKG
jgi:biotin synthase